jgi:hypothetical protein
MQKIEAASNFLSNIYSEAELNFTIPITLLELDYYQVSALLTKH